jgi:hypothetical protein
MLTIRVRSVTGKFDYERQTIALSFLIILGVGEDRMLFQQIIFWWFTVSSAVKEAV